MSVRYYTDFDLSEVEKIQCDMPGCLNSYKRIIRPPDSWKDMVKSPANTFPEPMEEGWATIRYPIAENIEERLDYCPDCMRRFGMKGNIR